jgi:hypothetical protein
MKNIVQVLAFREPDRWKLLAPSLWAALIEIENFYNFDIPRVQCVRYILGDAGGSLQECTSLPAFPSGASLYGPQSSHDAFWEPLQGKFRRTIHQGKLAETIRSLLPPLHKNWFFMIITDQEIEPPPDWRYIIWDEVTNGEVISTAPTDPEYWREHSANRVGAIKHRVRTAGMNVFGVFLGLELCANPRCFLFGDVASTDVLDTMLSLGAEHSWTQLTGLGYPPRPKNPNRVQSVEKVMLPEVEKVMFAEQEDASSTFEPDSEPGSEWNTYE